MMKCWDEIFDKILMQASSRKSLDLSRSKLSYLSWKIFTRTWIISRIRQQHGSIVMARHKDVTLAQEIQTMVVFTIGHVLRVVNLGLHPSSSTTVLVAPSKHEIDSAPATATP